MIGDHQTIHAALLSFTGILSTQHPFQQQLAWPEIPQPADILPVQGWIHFLSQKGGGIAGTGFFRWQKVTQIAKARYAMRHQHIKNPAQSAGYMQGVAQIQLHRRAIIASIPLPVTEYRGIGGQHQCFTTGCFGAFNDAFQVVTVLEQVKLHPVTHSGGSNPLQRNCGHHALTEGHPGTCSGFRQHPVALVGQQAVKTGGGNHQRHTDRLTIKIRGKIPL